MHLIPSTVVALTLACVPWNETFAEATNPIAGQQVECSIQISADAYMPYLLYIPTEEVPDAGWPLMLFLHGRGESYGPLSLVKKWGPPRIVDRGESLPFIIASPQCPGEGRWTDPDQQQGLLQLLDFLHETYQTDPDRVYLTGLSMGGYGSWRLAADHPGRFAAVVPICGGGSTEDAGALKSLPIWVFHGDQDRPVPFTRSVEMVEAIREAGGDRIRFTSLEGIGHNSWSAAYALPELYQWLLQQSIGRNQPPTTRSGVCQNAHPVPPSFNPAVPRANHHEPHQR